MTSTGWSDLMATALVGTSRRPWTPGASPLVPAGVEGGEAGLLMSAGAVALARRAGAVAHAGVAVPPPAPAENRPVAGVAALVRLEALLAADDEEHLGLWLRLAVTHGRTVPGRMLPELFRRARQHTAIRAHLTTVVGARGAWLAAQRDDWRPLLAAPAAPAADAVPDEAAWSHGTAPERLAFLTLVRRQDPDRARGLLAEAWPTEAPADRAALLAVLADGIGPADEELCEKARSDGRVAVRRQAVALLARIPGSAYRQRMADRATSYVSVGADGITVTPPVACDAEMKRDEIDPKPPTGTGERAFWAEQVIGVTPLATWDGGPDALVALPVADGWAPVLHRAWARAAAVQRNAAWATALLGHGYGRGDSVDIVDATIAAALHDQLDPATALAWVRDALDAGAASHTDLARLIAACPQPLPAVLVRPLLDHLRDQAVANRSYYVSPRLRELAVTIAAGLPLDAVRDVVRLATEHAEAATDKQQALVNVMTTVSDYVNTRHQMIQEFS